MKTTLDLPEEMLAEACKVSGLKTKRAVVLAALDEFIRAHRRRQLIAMLGTVEMAMTGDELEDVRHVVNPDKAAALQRWIADGGGTRG